MSIDENRIFRKGESIDQPLAFRITPILNPYFEGEPPIRTERDIAFGQQLADGLTK
jgi:hypothetical protein